VLDCFFAAAARTRERGVLLGGAGARALVEQVVEVDADFVERYLNDGDVDPRELHAPLEQALREGHLIPVCFVSARTGAGVAELLDVIERLLPNPTEGNPPQFLQGRGRGGRALARRARPRKHVIAHVFKVTVDPYVGKMGIFRIHQGTVTKDQLLHRRRPQALQGRPPVHAARQGRTSRCRAACRATSAPSRRSTRCTSTRCCTTPPKTITCT
jgi:elongation factor G